MAMDFRKPNADEGHLRLRRRLDVCGGLQLRGATEWMNPEHLFSSGVVSVADRAPRTDQQPAPARSGLTRCHAAAARRSIGATL
jgi:hypothetical protein